MGAALGLQASQAKNRMAGGEGFMDWLRGRHEAYTDAWHNAVVGIGNRGVIAADPKAPSTWHPVIVARRLNGEVGSPDEFRASELGQGLQALLDSSTRADSDQIMQRVIDVIDPDPASAGSPANAKQFEAVADLRRAALEGRSISEEEKMKLYEVAQNAGSRKVDLLGLQNPFGDNRFAHASAMLASDVARSPQAAYLVPLTGAGLALYGGYAATRPDEDDRNYRDTRSQGLEG